MKRFGSAAMFVLLGFLTGVYWNHRHTQSNESSTASVSVASTVPVGNFQSSAGDSAAAGLQQQARAAEGREPKSSAAIINTDRTQSGQVPCPPRFDPPTSSADVKEVLIRYAQCYRQDDRFGRKDHFTPVVDRYFEMEDRDPGWADAIEEKVLEVKPQLSTVSISDGSCHKNICRYILAFNTKSPSGPLWEKVSGEFVDPLSTQINGMGYNAALISNTPRTIKRPSESPSELKVYIFRTDIPADYLQPLGQLFELSDDELGKANSMRH